MDGSASRGELSPRKSREVNSRCGRPGAEKPSEAKKKKKKEHATSKRGNPGKNGTDTKETSRKNDKSEQGKTNRPPSTGENREERS